jgi:hypothetical protein
MGDRQLEPCFAFRKGAERVFKGQTYVELLPLEGSGGHEGEVEGGEEEEVLLRIRYGVLDVVGDGMCFFRAFIRSVAIQDTTDKAIPIIKRILAMDESHGLTDAEEKTACNSFIDILSSMARDVTADDPRAMLQREISGFRQQLKDSNGVGGNEDVFMLIAALFRANITIERATTSNSNVLPTSIPFAFKDINKYATDSRWGKEVFDMIESRHRRLGIENAPVVDAHVFARTGTHYKVLLGRPISTSLCRFCRQERIESITHAYCGDGTQLIVQHPSYSS